MKLARAIHFDESDTRVYANSARTGEWCISGGFEFSNWGEGDLTPNIEAARPVASEEIRQMQELCDDHDPNTLLTVARELSEGGVHEAYRVIDTPEADLGQFAIHGSLDE
jgi:hypothetical protein